MAEENKNAIGEEVAIVPQNGIQEPTQKENTTTNVIQM